MRIYRVTAEPGTEIHRVATLFERTHRGPRGWTVNEIWQGGTAFSDSPVIADAELEADCFDSLVSAEFEFDDWFSAVERQEIEQSWLTAPAAVIANDRWKVEDDRVEIRGPARVELVA